MDSAQQSLASRVSETDMTLVRLHHIGQAYIDAIIQVLTETDTDTPSAIAYIWSFEAKDCALLFRDYCVQLLKLEVYANDGIRGETYIETYRREGAQTINASLDKLTASLDRLKAENRVEDNWKHETNPTSFIIQQLKTIKDELKVIRRSQNKIDRIAKSLTDFRHNFSDYLDDRSVSIDLTHKMLLNTRQLIEEVPASATADQLRRLTAKIDEAENTLRNQAPMSSFDAITLEDVDEISVPIGTTNGPLEIKQIDVLSEVSSFYVKELATPLRQLDRDVNQFIERTRLQIFRASNRIKARLESGEEHVDWSKDRQLQGLDEVINDFEKEHKPTIEDEIGYVRTTLDIYVAPSQFFNKNHNFLPVSLLNQITSRSMTLGQSLKGRYSAKRFFSAIKSSTSKLFQNHSEQRAQTVFDHFNRLLDFNPESDQNTLFLRKGFLGSSFTIPREEHEAAVINYIDLWKNGFRGGLLIQGTSGSGRSTLLEKMPVMAPDMISYHIAYGGECVVNGERIRVNKKLIELLQLLDKQHQSDSYLVTIDDIEAFADDPNDLFGLIERLIKHQQRLSARLCLAMVMNIDTVERVDPIIAIKTSFSQRIDVSHMEHDKIEEALFIRANAVADHHNSDEETNKLHAQARRIASECNENIGLAMHLWVAQKGESWRPLDQVTTKHLIDEYDMLLRHLIIHRSQHISEFKDYFEDGQWRYLQEEINFLAQHRIIIRPSAGYISINPYLTYFIHQQLKA